MNAHVETVILDSQGFAAWIAEDRAVAAMFWEFHRLGADLVMSANTIVEVSHAKINLARLNWALSRIRIEPVTQQAARAAAGLLKDTGLHGHKYAIDATVAEVALRMPGPVAMLTSDVDDMRKLCGDRVRLIAI